jgi:uncharacterized protein
LTNPCSYILYLDMKNRIQIQLSFVLSLTIVFTMTGQALGIGQVESMTDTHKTAKELSKKQANHLKHEKSPYLQQHVYNPVDWYPWGEEALAKAVAEDKPIFLSIGYSTCHWCHVMAHESFEDQEIADYLNAHFICIKVDREERPGIDQIYMAATQAMTGGGGWPMSLFLLPDTKPFYAGTYFPPRAAHGRPGFLDVLQGLHEVWGSDRKKLSLSADQITAHISKTSDTGVETLEKTWLSKGFSQIEASYEPKYGGFSGAPKFPRPVVIDFLFRYYRATGNKGGRDMALYTLEQMAGGGMYDHIGGGFHRYSVDGEWRVPHFEKMLYDQSQLVSVYLSAYQLTKNPLYKKIVTETLEYILRDMQYSEGGFYSAEDADSVNPYNPDEHSEGAYYLWTEDEVDSLLNSQEAALFKTYYGVKKNGNALYDPQKEFTGRNILYHEKDLSEAGRELKLSEDGADQLLSSARLKLLNKRKTRTAPHLDDKIITSWDGLMISAFARAGMILEEERYLLAADRATDFILTTLLSDGELKRRWREGEARYAAGLDDYSFFIQGLLDLYMASHDPSRLQKAIELSEVQSRLFGDKNGGFYDIPESANLLTRMKAAYDGAEPSGNSVAAINLLRLSALTGNKQWGQLADECIKSFGKALASYPAAMPLMLSAMEFQMDKSKQIVIAGERGKADTKELLREVHRRYLPNSMVLLADNSENQDFLKKYLPFMATVKTIDGKASAYVCENFTCKMPVNSRKELAALLDGKALE